MDCPPNAFYPDWVEPLFIIGTGCDGRLWCIGQGKEGTHPARECLSGVACRMHRHWLIEHACSSVVLVGQLLGTSQMGTHWGRTCAVIADKSWGRADGADHIG
jgi:hypothetical protein